MKNILLPTDFSDNAWNAIEYALKLFKDVECKFHLFNAYTPAFYHVEYVLISPAQYGINDMARDTSQANLQELKLKIQKRFGDNPKHKIESVARFDTLILGLRELVLERDIDVIVMGTKGSSGAKEVFLGSNTVHVLKNIKIPILAIPDGFKYTKPSEILFPTDYEIPYNSNHLDLIMSIAEDHKAKINIMHVSYGYDLTESQKKNTVALEKFLENTTHLFHNVFNENIEDAIKNFVINAKIKLLVMVNNKHSIFENILFKSKIKQLGSHLTIPFLVIPAKQIKH